MTSRTTTPTDTGSHMRGTVKYLRVPRQGSGSEPLRVIAGLAQAFPGKTERWAERRLYEYPTLRDVTIAAIRVYRQSGDDVGLIRFGLPIRQALDGKITPKLTKHLRLLAQSADVDEELPEKAFDLNECRATAEAWLRALDRQILHSQALRMALADRWAL